MKNSEIIKAAIDAEKDALAAKNYREGDFFIGSKVDEVLPNGKVSTLICVDCSWLKELDQQTAIIDRNDLDEVANNDYKDPSIKIDIDYIILTKWMDMVDMDGDIHHCKVESYIELSTDIFHPVEDTSEWVIYVEV